MSLYLPPPKGWVGGGNKSVTVGVEAGGSGGLMPEEAEHQSHGDSDLSISALHSSSYMCSEEEG